MNFSLLDVWSEYAFHRDSTALADADACCFATVFWGAIGQIRIWVRCCNFGRGWRNVRECHVTTPFPSGGFLTRPMNGLCTRAVSRHSRNFRLRGVSRPLHTAKPLPYPVEGGLGEFLPPAAVKTIGVEYQQGLLDRLNEQVHGASRIRI